MLTRIETARWLYGAETVSILLCAMGFVAYWPIGIEGALTVSYGFLLVYLIIQHFSELL